LFYFCLTANGAKVAAATNEMDSSSNDPSSPNLDPKEVAVERENRDSSDDGVVVGPTTRRAWSDWCSSRGKSSKENSEDDTHHTINNTQRGQKNGNAKGTRTATAGKKKKKVLRKKKTRNKVKICHKNCLHVFLLD